MYMSVVCLKFKFFYDVLITLELAESYTVYADMAN